MDFNANFNKNVRSTGILCVFLTLFIACGGENTATEPKDDTQTPAGTPKATVTYKLALSNGAVWNPGVAVPAGLLSTNLASATLIGTIKIENGAVIKNLSLSSDAVITTAFDTTGLSSTSSPGIKLDKTSLCSNGLTDGKIIYGRLLFTGSATIKQSGTIKLISSPSVNYTIGLTGINEVATTFDGTSVIDKVSGKKGWGADYGFAQ